MASKGKLRRGQLLNRTRRGKRGFTARKDEEGWHCTWVKIVRIALGLVGLTSIAFSVRNFHAIYEFEGLDQQAAFRRAFTRTNRTKAHPPSNLRKSLPVVTAEAPLKPIKDAAVPLPPDRIPSPPEQQHRSVLAPVVEDVKPISQALNLPHWEIPTDTTFNKTAFEQRLTAWKEHRKQLYKQQYLRWLPYAVQNPRRNSNSTLRIIPHLHQTPMFRKRFSWDLMVVVMADNQCPLAATKDGEMVSATGRLLTTLKDVLQSEMVEVIAYLPNYHEGTVKCHNRLFQAIVSAFPTALKTGQLQIVTSPQQEQDRGEVYRYALNGLDFAYAAELGHRYADLVLFLQAGSRLVPEWWIQYEPVQTEAPATKPPGNATLAPKLERRQITTNRDYAWEIMLARENWVRHDDQGVKHQLCYMNFAKHVGPQERRYASLENPTGALWDSAQLMRFSLVLRSYAPYGKQSVSQLLHRYCKDLLWAADFPRSNLLLFEYSPKGNETQFVPQTDLQPIPKATTYPYATVTAEEVPLWVSVPPSMVGPHPTGQANPLLWSLDPGEVIIPTAAAIQSTPAQAQKWITFVIPTAWRHTVSGDTKGNKYVVDCIRQLSGIIEVSFQDKYKASILALVSGRNAADVAHHRAGLEAEFGPDIRRGILKLVDAPIDQYPTLHGLDTHYQDTETRVRWRSKQNLDISAALFAAKGLGKYIMVIEDDSGFRAPRMFNGIRQAIADLHRKLNPEDAADYNPRIFANGIDQSKLQIQYNEGHGPAEVELGHREVWSQLRFSFGYSGVLVHDEDAFVFAMMHFLLYQEKPCDLLFEIPDSVRNGISRNHFLRFNQQHRFITHAGKMSTLEGKVFSDEQIAKG